MEINDILRSHQPECSEVRPQPTLVEGTPEDAPMSRLNRQKDAPAPMPSIYGCSPAGDDGGYVVLVWGIDEKGQQIKVLINTCDQKTARHAAAAALADLGAYAHFFIAPTKDKALIERWQKPWQGFVPTRHSSPAQAPLSLHHEVSI
jgi:hypothetical protein